MTRERFEQTAFMGLCPNLKDTMNAVITVNNHRCYRFTYSEDDEYIFRR